jgi:hypothetical protein
VDAARAVKGKLMSTTTIFDDSVVQGLRSEEDSAAGGSVRQGAGSSLWLNPLQSAVTASPAEAVPLATPVEKAEEVAQAPMGENVKLERPLPTLPQRAKQTAEAIQRPAEAIQRTAQPVQTVEEPKEIFYIEGRPVHKLRDPQGRAEVNGAIMMV